MNGTPHEITLKPDDNSRLANLCGQFDAHLRQIEERLGVEIRNRGNQFRVFGDEEAARQAVQLLDALYELAGEESIDAEQVNLHLQESGRSDMSLEPGEGIRTRRGPVRPRGEHQRQYLDNMRLADLTFGIGPAGTGKTYLAVARAVEALDRDEVRRLILVRPAVEAGERLGFLPGDLAQKVDPYLRPIYDALYDMLGFERVGRLIERNVIEVAPLAYMRGRSLNDAFVILDEAQNTTPEQMMMFLTRIGFGSKTVVTGDITQTDLPRGQQSGLRQVIEVLKPVNGVRFTWFDARDVVRHPLVQKIVEAYDSYDKDDS